MIRSVKAFALVGALVAVSFAQTAPASNQSSASPADNNRASAYYNFAMGRLYALMAQAEGNQEQALKAIQYYKEALKADPKAADTYAELTDLYLAVNRSADAVALAQDALKQNPDNIAAHRMLGRVYFSQINKGSQGQIDEKALHLAMTEFQKVVDKDPKDTDSWVTLGRLYAGTNDSSDAEKAYNAALALDPSNVYANAMQGNWMLQNGGSLTEAVQHLDVAVSTGKARPFVRTLQLGGLIDLDEKGARTELMKAANDMRKSNEAIDDHYRKSILDTCFDPIITDHGELQECLSAVPPDEAWKTYLWLDNKPGNGQSGSLVHDFVEANLLEITGKKQESLAKYRLLQQELNNGSGTMKSSVDAAITRLSRN